MALEVAGFDDGSAMTYGKVRASLAQRGSPIAPLDTLIGSHAWSRGNEMMPVHSGPNGGRALPAMMVSWHA